MTPRSFLQNQLRDQERAKLAALPTDAVLTILLSQKQAFDPSLTALSGKAIGAKGLDLLASSTSAAAINALGGAGGQLVSAMIESLDASKLTGTIDVARLPVIPGNNSLSATSIAGLTTLQQAAVSLGTMVYTADGGAWRYSGSGSKTAEASYYYTADVTPEWNAIANKPPFGSAAFQSTGAFASAAQGAKADSAMQPGASSDVLTEGSVNLFHSESRVRATLLAGLSAVSNLAVAASDTVIAAFGKVQAQINALALGKFDKTGGAVAGNIAPDATNSRSLGTNALKYLQAWVRQVYIGDDTATNALLRINGALATELQFAFSRAGLNSWRHRVDASAQSGSNAGSGYALDSYDDAGVLLRVVYTISRATGVVTFGVRPTVSGAGAVETQNNKGQANGYAPLGADNLVPSSFLPASGSYKGSWDASTNTPTITAGVGTNGDEYTVSKAGTQSVTGTATAFAIGDRIKFTSNGNKWERIPNSQAVSSVFGRTGLIAAASGDYTSAQITHGAGSLAAALALLAPLSSPALAGTPTAPTAAVGTNTDQIATMAALKAGLDGLVAAAPGALDTLDELAAALGDDPNFRTTILNAIAEKEVAFDTLDGGAI